MIDLRMHSAFGGRARGKTSLSRVVEWLSGELQNTNDASAYNWWKQQKLVGTGVPNHGAWCCLCLAFGGVELGVCVCG